MQRIIHLSMALALLSLSACGSKRAFAPAPQAAIRAAQDLGAAEACTADLVIQIKRPEADSLSFTASLWLDATDRFRLHLSKLGKSFLSARFDPDGSLIAVLVMDDLAVRTDLESLAQAAKELDAERGNGELAQQQFNLLSDMRLLIDELKTGPVPIADSYQTSQRHPGALACEMRNGQRAAFTVLPTRSGDIIGQKWLYRLNGDLLAHIRYDHYERFDGLLRPTRMALDLPRDDNTYRMRLRRFAAVPGIDPGRMQIPIGSSDQVVAPRDFLVAMIGERSP